MLNITLFGPWQINYQDQQITMPTDKSRALLAYLLLTGDQPHTREGLAGLLWSEWPEEGARRNVRQTVHRIKEVLEETRPGLGEQLWQNSRQTLQLNQTLCQVDVWTAEQNLRHITHHAHPSLPQCPSCLGRLKQAIDLYRGEVLTGLSIPDAETFESWLLATREHWHQRMLGAISQLAAAYETCATYDLAQQYALRLLALDPFYEDGHRLLMRVAVAQGERAQALKQFEGLAELLEKELGVTPSPETVQLYEQIRTQKERPPTPAAPLSPPQIHHLPPAYTPFIGRAEELQLLAQVLHNPEVRLLTILGSGGIGKTRLAAELAQLVVQQFAQGVYFVSLTAVSHTDLLLPAVAQALGVVFEEGASLLAQLQNYLQGQELLLILDNFDQVLGGATQLLDLLTPAGVKLLLTSREPLYLQPEYQFHLQGLPFTAEPTAAEPSGTAYQLFLATAQRLQPHFQPTPAEQSAIWHICQLVHGVPLALEMAASWVRQYDCPTIAQEITRNLDFLVTPLRHLPPRQQSMRAVFAYSWSFLTPAEQLLLGQLAELQGSFALAAALHLTQSSLVELAPLLDKSLLHRQNNQRYVLHPLLRQFVREQELPPAGRETARQRLVTYYLEHLGRQLPALRGGQQKEALNHIEQELDNIWQAWQLAITQQLWPLLDPAGEALFHFYDTRSRYQEGVLAFEQLNQALPAETLLRAKSEARLGWLYFHLGDFTQAQTLLTHSLAYLSSQGSPPETVFTLNYLAAVTRHRGVYDQARHYVQQSLALAEKYQDIYGRSVALNILGQLALLEGAYPAAQAHCQESLRLKRLIQDEWGMTFSLLYLGRTALRLEQFQEAEGFFQEAWRICTALGDKRGLALAAQHLGETAQKLGEWATAGRYYEQSGQLYQHIGYKTAGAIIQERLEQVKQQLT